MPFDHLERLIHQTEWIPSGENDYEFEAREDEDELPSPPLPRALYEDTSRSRDRNEPNHHWYPYRWSIRLIATNRPSRPTSNDQVRVFDYCELLPCSSRPALPRFVRRLWKGVPYVMELLQ